MFDQKNINDTWKDFKNELLFRRDEFVPVKVVKHGKRPPWLKRKVKKAIDKRHKFWKEYKINPSYENMVRYKSKRNEVTVDIRKAKADFELKLAENIKEDPKSFYSYVRSKSKSKGGIGPLKDIDGNNSR